MKQVEKLDCIIDGIQDFLFIAKEEAEKYPEAEKYLEKINRLLTIAWE